MNDLTIRNALIADAIVLCDAERETARTPGLLISRPSEFSCKSFEEKIGVLGREGFYVVAERGGLVVGHALLEPYRLEALAHVYSLTIVVHPNNLGRGVGDALMTALLKWAQARPGLLKIELRVRETNLRARRLYAKFGFIEEGRLEKRILLPDGTFIADITMAWLQLIKVFRAMCVNRTLADEPAGLHDQATGMDKVDEGRRDARRVKSLSLDSRQNPPKRRVYSESIASMINELSVAFLPLV